jgi:hypothetical protein
MEDEERLFYDNELDFFAERDNENSSPDLHRIPLVSSQSIVNETSSPLDSTPALNFRAYNPLDRLKDMPEEKQSEYFYMFNNHKRFNGIQHFF